MAEKEGGEPEGRPQPGRTTHPPPPIPPPGNYLVVLDQFHISKTRSVHLDTDYVTLTAQVNQQPPVNQTVFVGDVNDGDHPVNLQLGPFFVGPNDTPSIQLRCAEQGAF